jgi:ribose transport system substrate-binding protein
MESLALYCQTTKPASKLVWLFVSVWLLIAGNAFAGDHKDSGSGLSLDEMRQTVSVASDPAWRWAGPESGPAGQPGMTIAVVCEDLRNGGVLGVARGIKEAAAEIGWHIRIFDARGSKDGRREELAAALASKPDGAILVGSDAASLESSLSQFTRRGIPLVGWHVAAKPGALSAGSVALNVSTDPLEVARVAAMAAVVDSQARAGVVIFTDSNFEIATAKANEMAKIIKQCKSCTLLEMRDVPISQSASLIPEVTRELLARYGKRWTHALAINDIFFDYMTPELTQAGRDIHLFSAGDGSPAAFLRIQAGLFQRGTVAEPLNLQGWQIVDDLNRLLAQRPVSAYVVPVHLVTQENMETAGEPKMAFDPDNGYRRVYRRIWKRQVSDR